MIEEFNRFLKWVRAKIGFDLLILLLYLILTLILLYPFSVLNINTQLIGDGGDTYQGLWNLWWVKHSIIHLRNPYETNYIFYPIGTSLYVHTLSPLAGLFSIPFQFAFGLIFSFNFLVILSFVLAGYGAYRLAYYLIKDQKASFFSGIIFAFSTYHFARAFGHLNLVSIQWIPLCIMFLLKMRKEKSLNNIFLASFFLLLSALWGDLQYLVFLGLFILGFLVNDLLFNRQQIKNYIKKLGLMIIICTGVIAIVFGPLLYGFLNGKYLYALPSSKEQLSFSADLLGFFIPNARNLFFGSHTEGIISQFKNPWIEGMVYIGYVVLSLTTFSIVKLLRIVKSWLIAALGFIVLALGPILHIFGVSSFSFFNVSIVLPGSILFSILPIPRVPSRFIIMSILCLAIVSAFAINYLNKLFNTLKHGKVFGFVFLFLISGLYLAETNISPFPVVEHTSVPQFYYELSKMKTDFSVLDLPMNYHANNRYMYYGTISEKPLVVGAISRISPENFNFLDAFPIINQMNYVENGNELSNWKDILIQDVKRANLNFLFLSDVRYIILHKDMLNEAAFEQMNNYLTDLLGKPVFYDDQIFVYITNYTNLVNDFIYLSNGWTNWGEIAEIPTRYMDGRGVVKVVTPSMQVYNLTFSAGTEFEVKKLQVFLNEEKLGEFEIYPNVFSKITLNDLKFNEGVNEVVFQSEQYFIPADVIEGSTDTRHISIAFQNITFVPQ